MPTLPMGPASSWMDSFDETTSRLFGRGDYELYEGDDEFVLTIEMPGFDSEDIDLRWGDGRLHVAAEAEDDRTERTYYRSFRFPKRVEADSIEAEYRNGVLEVTLPIEGLSVPGEPIDIA